MSQHDDRLVRRVAEVAAGRDPDGPCPDAEVLGLYAERGLDGDEYGRAEAHLAGCARCQATVAALVRSAPEAAEVAGAAGQGVGGVRRWWAGWRWLAPVTATAAVGMLALWVGRGPSDQAAESARVEAGPTVSERAPLPPEPLAPAQPPGGVAGSGAGSPPALRKDADARPAQRAAAAESPAAPPAASALAASEARFERAQPERQREVETRRDAATDQFRAAAVPPAPPAGVPPSPAAASPPAPAEETLAASASSATTAAARGRGARAPVLNDAAAPGSMAKATASGADAAAGIQRMVDLTGRVTYRTRQALPAGATIDVRLLDVSRMDVPAQELGRIVIVTKGEQAPVPFAIRYDANAIDARRRYSVQATITIEGRVAFRTTTAHLVLTNGGSGTDVEVVVEPQR